MNTTSIALFEEYITRWQLIEDGDPILTPGARLVPVRFNGHPAMLKIAIADEEKSGGRCMDWWEGHGAARVLAIHDNAILLERATGGKNLTALSRSGSDDEATKIICQTIALLHGKNDKSLPEFPALPELTHLPELTPLPVWFTSLKPAAARYGGLFFRSDEAADLLLSHQQDIGVLHGDIHHGNVLDFGTRGWLVIDPKGLYGDRVFDYANLFCNPDPAIAANKTIFLRRLDIVSEVAGIDRQRLLKWILAWSGLSAAWMIEDGVDGGFDMAIAQLAVDELDTM